MAVNLADSVALDSMWLRRIRGKLDAPEIEKARTLADEDIKIWLRQLYGPESDSQDEIETIPVSDTDDTPFNVADHVIDDLFHLTSGALDRWTHTDYKRIVQIAELIASHYLVQWGDFMGDAAQSEGSSQLNSIGNAIRRMKLEVERIGSLVTSSAATPASTRYYFQRTTVLKTNLTTRRKSRR